MFKTVVIFGGSGFIGGYIIRRLSKLGYRIIVPTSSFAKTSKLKVMGDVGQILPISFNSTKYEDVKKIMNRRDYNEPIKMTFVNERGELNSFIFR